MFSRTAKMSSRIPWGTRTPGWRTLVCTLIPQKYDTFLSMTVQYCRNLCLPSLYTHVKHYMKKLRCVLKHLVTFWEDLISIENSADGRVCR
jgi:hypothetical protein